MILIIGWNEPARTVPVRLIIQAAFLPILDADQMRDKGLRTMLKAEQNTRKE